jgi:iron complex transport system ATP-binding protein
LQRPHEGVIEIDNLVANSLSELDRARKISWTESEHSSTFAYTAEDTILWGRWPYHQGAPTKNDVLMARKAAELMGIEDKLSRPVTTLSLGERKKVHLAKSIASDASYLIWDEPCGPLDIRSALDLMERGKVITAQGRTIIMSLHDIGIAKRFADFITILEDGAMAWRGLARDEDCNARLSTAFNVPFDSDGYPI